MCRTAKTFAAAHILMVAAAALAYSAASADHLVHTAFVAAAAALAADIGQRAWLAASVVRTACELASLGLVAVVSTQ